MIWKGCLSFFSQHDNARVVSGWQKPHYEYEQWIDLGDKTAYLFVWRS